MCEKRDKSWWPIWPSWMTQQRMSNIVYTCAWFYSKLHRNVFNRNIRKLIPRFQFYSKELAHSNVMFWAAWTTDESVLGQIWDKQSYFRRNVADWNIKQECLTSFIVFHERFNRSVDASAMISSSTILTRCIQKEEKLLKLACTPKVFLQPVRQH